MKHFQVIIFIFCVFFIMSIKGKENSHNRNTPTTFGCGICGYDNEMLNCTERIYYANLRGYAYVNKEEKDTITPHIPGKDRYVWNDEMDCVPTTFSIAAKPEALCLWEPTFGCFILGNMPDDDNVTFCRESCVYSGLCPCGYKKKQSAGTLSTLPYLFLIVLVLYLNVCQI